ncbi:MAG: hypothetical protein ACRDXX_11690 [Stackebrandtia sp.]
MLVVGCCGAGKSTVARELADRLGLPLTHLDQEYWRPGWVRPEPDEWRARVAELIAEDAWIHDGNYDSTLETRLARADTVVFVDTPRRRCLWRIAKRRILRNRADPLDDCAERIDWEFVGYVWRFPADHRVRLLEKLNARAGRVDVVRLRTPSQIRGYLDGLKLLTSFSSVASGLQVDASQGGGASASRRRMRKHRQRRE